MASLLRRLADYFRDRSGNISVLTVASIPAFLAASGMAIDYGRAIQAKQALQHAVDTASLALANAQVLEEMRPDSDARRFVEANLPENSILDVTDVDVLQREGGYAFVEATATLKTYIVGIAGVEEWTLGAQSEAQFNNPEDVDVVVLLDNSPSMLIGSTRADMAGISQVSRRLGAGNCAFACHYPGRDTYTVAHAEGWNTRLDAAKLAVNDALRIAEDSTESSNAEVYFALKTFTAGYQELADGTAESVRRSGVVDRLEPIGRPRSRIYEQSDQELALERIAIDMRVRARDNPERRRFLILITDGVTNMRRRRRVVQAVDPAWCAAAKASGARVGVIYTTYFDDPGSHTWRRYVRPISNDIGPSLEQCASPGWFFEAQYEEDIRGGLRTMMESALPKPRLTQ